MKTAMDDRSVAQRVLDHIANGTTDVGEEVWREPVANYRSRERLDAEIEHVLRGAPGVDDAAVVGVPSERWGEEVVAVLVAQGNLTGIAYAEINAREN